MESADPFSTKEPRVGCGAVMIRDGKILLMRRLKAPEAGCWGIAGGKVDLYETAAEAARREIAEELGVEIAADQLLCLVDQIDRETGEHWLSPVYLAEAFEGNRASWSRTSTKAWPGSTSTPRPSP